MKHGKTLLCVLATATLLAFAGQCLAAETVQTKVVNGTRVSLSVIPVERADLEDPRAPGGIEKWRGGHRIVVQLADVKTGRPIADVDVQLNFAPRGFAGEEQRLNRTSSGGKVWYETIVDLPQRRATYRARVHFREAGAGATREVEFEYRHHH